MAKETVAAGAHPSEIVTEAKRGRAAELKAKGKNRTKGETDELVDLLLERVAALEAR